MRFLAVAVLFFFVSCSRPSVKPAAKSAMRSAAAIPAKSLWLTYSNTATWTVDVVEYKTNLADPWRVYCYVTNGYTNEVWLPLTPTNDFCAFRVGFVRFR